MNVEGVEVGQVVQVFSSIMTPCPFCSGDASKYDDTYVASRINHLLDEHSGVLLHVGQQTDTDGDGKPWQMTTAIVGIPR